MTVRQTVTFAATPAQVYAALIGSQSHAAFTGAPAAIGSEEGQAWSAYGGAITGRQVELIEGQRIVQTWRAGNWAPGKHSVVHVELAAAGEGTELTLEHAGFPDGQGEHLAGGWEERYWAPLRAWLAR